MKAFCCECGFEVETIGETFYPGGVVKPTFVGYCKRHPSAKRTLKNWVHERFEFMRKMLDAMPDGPGRVFRSTGGEPIQRIEIRGYAWAKGVAL